MLNNPNNDKVIVVPLSVLEKNDPNAIEQNKVLLSALQDNTKKITSINIKGSHLMITYNDITPASCINDNLAITNFTGVNCDNKGYSISFGTELPKGNHSPCYATGPASFAIGAGNNAKGDYSVAMGYFCKADGLQSFAMGGVSLAEGKFSCAIGTYCKAMGNSSCAIGGGCEALLKGEFACGMYNKGGNLFSVGNGSSNDDRSNAMWLDSDNKLYIGDKIILDGKNGVITLNGHLKIPKGSITVGDSFDNQTVIQPAKPLDASGLTKAALDKADKHFDTKYELFSFRTPNLLLNAKKGTSWNQGPGGIYSWNDGLILGNTSQNICKFTPKGSIYMPGGLQVGYWNRGCYPKAGNIRYTGSSIKAKNT